jgi:hypothetical protein
LQLQQKQEKSLKGKCFLEKKIPNKNRRVEMRNCATAQYEQKEITNQDSLVLKVHRNLEILKKL